VFEELTTAQQKQIAKERIREMKKKAPEASRFYRMRCSFCGFAAEGDRVVVTGAGVNICSECVDVCNQIIEEKRDRTRVTRFVENLKETATA
jgi:hypothetical protein